MGTRRVGRWRTVAALLMALVLCSSAVVFVPPAADAQAGPTVAEVNAALGVGVNLGNALEAPREGDWGLTLQAEYFDLIAGAGFDHVRVPIKFSAYAAAAPPYLIPEGEDPNVANASNLWERIDWIIEQSEANGLYVILDLHHYDELHDDVAGHRDRFLAIWSQIATRYANAGPQVLFEVLNEPNAQFDDDPALLNSLLADALTVIRSTNPTRPVLVGPARYNNIGALDSLVLPNDPNLIVSIHFYEPFPFTHQGAEWQDPILPTPIVWDAQLMTFGAAWQNWSWETEITATSTGLTADYGRQWAGIQLARPDSPFDPASMNLTVAGDGRLALQCGPHDDGNNDTDLGEITVTNVATSFQIDMSACPADSTRIVAMMASESFGPIVFSAGQLCTVDGRCERLIETGAQAVESRFDQAQAWGQANNRPLNVGEFGVYGAGGVAPLSERAEWTTFVRQVAQTRTMSVSYWEFGAGFGIYDPAAGEWILPLREALLGSAFNGDGDVNCDGLFGISDALVIAQYVVGVRTDVGSCPLGDPTTQINTVVADLDRNGDVNIVDALLVAQCVVGAIDHDCPNT